MTFQSSDHKNQPTKFCFLFGKNLRTSMSSKMHNFWFKNYQFNCDYKNYIIQGADECVDAIRHYSKDENFLGGNVTMPFKQTVFEYFNDVFTMSQSVKSTASSNTLFRDQNGNFGLENTDVMGIQKTLQTLCSPNILFENILIYGGGGASASCIYYVLNSGLAKKVTCLTRNILKSENGFRKSKFLDNCINNQILTIKELTSTFLHSDLNLNDFTKKQELLLIINTLPLGDTKMYPKPNVFCDFILKKCNSKNTYFFDLVYDVTDVCKTAKKLGISYQNGELMLKTQAAHSFKLWTGVYPAHNT